jgi:hypothetical protein
MDGIPMPGHAGDGQLHWCAAHQRPGAHCEALHQADDHAGRPPERTEHVYPGPCRLCRAWTEADDVVLRRPSGVVVCLPCYLRETQDARTRAAGRETCRRLERALEQQDGQA